MRRRPAFAVLTGFGLALGLACFLLIGVFVAGELRFDRHHDGANRIVRIGMTVYPPSGGTDNFAMTSPPAGRIIREEFPEVESLVRFKTYTPSLKVGPQAVSVQNVWISEPDLFDVFTLPVVDGQTSGLLDEPATAVLSLSTAARLFGEGQAVGQYLTVDDTLQVLVSAVIADQPRTSHMDPGVIVSWSTYDNPAQESRWLAIGTYTYARLGPGVATEGFQARILNLVEDRYGDVLSSSGLQAELVIEPLTDIYLRSSRTGQLGPVGNLTHVWIFAAIAVFILLLAVVNFSNLATARSMDRAREVGIRKAVGSSRQALVVQFLGESLFLGFLAFMLSLVLVVAGVSLLNALAGTNIGRSELFSVIPMVTLLGVSSLSGILGGLYPALVLSGLGSADVLKGTFRSSGRGILLRKSLVAFQFAISIGLLACTAVVVQQMDFVQSTDLGFDQEQMLILDLNNVPRSELRGRSGTVRDAFSGLAGISGVSTSATIPGRTANRALITADSVEPDEVRSAGLIGVGYDFITNYGIDVVAGRTFSSEFPADVRGSVVINSATVSYLGLTTAEEAVGKQVGVYGAPRTVVGVVADYHHRSLHEAVEPLMMIPMPNALGYVSLRLAPGSVNDTMAEIDEAMANLFPGATYSSYFLDEDFNQQYHAEDQLRSLFTVFAMLAILIACLGLIGLASFTAQQRTKEIGVRKVLGASVPGIVSLLSREFAFLIGVGFFLAVPAAAYAMNLWLDTFPYHTSLGVMPFLMAGLGALLIALMSVGYQSFRAASADPVRSLRSE